MAGHTPDLGDCTFYAEPNQNGYYVGHCPQYPDLRGRPRRNRIDALDDIITTTRDRIRHQTATIAQGRRHG